VIFDIDNEVWQSIITGWLSWYLAHLDWIWIQFNNEGLDIFVRTLSQSSLMSDWFTNRSQIWMIIIRDRRTCPALLIANLTWMTNWSSTRMSTGTGSTVELDDRQFYRCIRLHVFNSTKTASFILPDDKFKLMRYVFLIGPAINDSTIDGYRLTSIVLCFHHQWNRYQPSTVYGCNQGNKPSAIDVALGIPTRPASTAIFWEEFCCTANSPQLKIRLP